MKAKRNYVLIIMFIIALIIVCTAVYLGVSHLTQIKFDNTQPFHKNITVIEKSRQGGLYIIRDSKNTNYTASEKSSLSMQAGLNYSITVLQTNNGTGYWIESVTKNP